MSLSLFHLNLAPRDGGRADYQPQFLDEISEAQGTPNMHDMPKVKVEVAQSCPALL